MIDLRRKWRRTTGSCLILAAWCVPVPLGAQLPDEDEDLPRPSMHTPTPTPAPGFAAGPASVLGFEGRDGRQLLLRVPMAWSAEGGPAPQGTIQIDLKPKAGRAFFMQITAIPLQPAEVSRLQNEGLRQFVQQQGEDMLTQAREKSITLEPVVGSSGRGYLYTITDARASLPRGEWRYVTGGGYVAGDQLLTVWLFSNEGTGAVKMQAADVLRSATPVAVPR